MKNQNNYFVDYHTGAGNFKSNDDLYDTKDKADAGAAYTQQNISVTDLNSGAIVATRHWYGVVHDADDCDEDCDCILFRHFGYYDGWQDYE